MAAGLQERQLCLCGALSAPGTSWPRRLRETGEAFVRLTSVSGAAEDTHTHTHPFPANKTYFLNKYEDTVGSFLKLIL